MSALLLSSPRPFFVCFSFSLLALEGSCGGEVAQRATTSDLTLPLCFVCLFVVFWGGELGLWKVELRWGLKAPPHLTLAPSSVVL